MTELLTVIENSKSHNAKVTSEVACGRAPDIDYPFFAVACRQAGAEALFAHFVVGRDHARVLLDRSGGRPTTDVVNRLLTGAGQSATGTDAKIARTRGAQLELLKSASIRTHIHARELRARMTTNALSAPDTMAARLLNGYVQPLPATLAAASACTGRGPAWLSRLTCGELGHDYIGDYPVPAAFRSFLRMLRRAPRAPTDSAFATDNGPLSTSRLRAELNAVMGRTHLRLNVAHERDDAEPHLASVDCLEQ